MQISNIIKVLIVEDDNAYALLISKMLKNSKYSEFIAKAVGDLQLAMKRIAKDDIDVILLDLCLPDENGLDMLDILCSSAINIPVVVLTNSDDEITGIKAIQKGAQDYLVKAQFNEVLLAKSIRHAIERHLLLTELKQNTKALKASEERFSRIIGQNEEVISIVSHELRSPLTSIINSLSLIADGETGEISDKTRKLINVAHRSSLRMIRLANDMLDINKIESGSLEFHFQPYEIMPLIEQSIEANRDYAEQFGIEFILENHLSGIKVNVDSDRLMQIMTNLLTNAAKFSPPDGKVNVSVSHHGGLIRIAVKDKGQGIPKEFHNRIFDKFTQAHLPGSQRKDGSGLGLSISKMLVERMSGTIGFETKINEGTTFFFDLPKYYET
jgi:signal transduction histidine kinase